MLFVDMPRGIATVDLAHRSYCWAVNALTMADFNAAAVAMSAHAYSIVNFSGGRARIQGVAPGDDDPAHAALIHSFRRPRPSRMSATSMPE